MVLWWLWRRQMSSFFGLIYIFAYLGFVLLVPMLLIAAGLVCIFRELNHGKGPNGNCTQNPDGVTDK